MKHRFHLLFTLLATAWLSASAYDFMVDGIAYDKNSDSTSVTVTYTNNSYFNYNGLNGTLTIPEEVAYDGKTYSVTSIGKHAFYGCSGLTSLNIGKSVTSIGNYAFDHCSGLTSVEYNAVNCSGPSLAWFPNSLLKTLKIGDDVKSIPNYLAYEQKNLTSVTIGNSVTEIGEWAFYGCSEVTSLTIPNTVTSIGKYAFHGCGLTGSFTIPDSVTSIGNYAFQYCSVLTSLTIGKSVTSIGNGAFQYCSELSSVEYNAVNCGGPSSGGTTWFQYSPLKTLKIGDDVKSIPNYLAYNQTNLTSITIGNSVTEIGARAFFGCSALTGSLTIPNSVTTIGDYAFASTELTSLNIGHSVTDIGDYAFWGCTSLKEVRVKREDPPKAYTNTFSYQTYRDAVLYVPKGTVDIYSSKVCWREFTKIAEDIVGDVNGNGVVDAEDINLLINQIIRIILGIDTADKYNGRTDVDDNGVIDMADVNLLVNILLLN